MAGVLLDTGPLVALFKRNDAYHRLAVAWFKRHSGALLTTHTVVTEAWHLLREPARLSLVRFVTRACDVRDLGREGPARVLHMLERFGDIPIDTGDFAAYRTQSGAALENVFRAAQ